MMKTYTTPELVCVRSEELDILTLSSEANGSGKVWDLSGKDLFL